MEQTTRHPQGNCEVWVRYTAYPKECHEWAISRFGNGAVLFNVITNIRAQRVPPRLTPPSRRRFPQGKALETKNHRLSQASGNLKLQNLRMGIGWEFTLISFCRYEY